MVVTLDLHPTVELTDEQFERICRANRNLKLERTAKGELVIMALTGGETGRRNLRLTGQLWFWNQQSNLGEGFDSSTGFRLPNGAIRSPDAAWVRLDRWQALTSEQRKKFVPLCPDFVVELASPSDELEDIREKMLEYLANGLRLGWLIDPSTQTVEIYRPNQPVEILNQPATLSGENILPEFVLNLTGILTD
ncbi:Uma2 family endonuclease [Microseira sp. BLCC-F43]|jgi:Uma2 family endonuclease|uniref:Uma2 family endonuclease n=1 Tax=Microseira sp. BLCC-F43 TaxID=3153602 RepID=UPI0035BAABFB